MFLFAWLLPIAVSLHTNSSERPNAVTQTIGVYGNELTVITEDEFQITVRNCTLSTSYEAIAECQVSRTHSAPLGNIQRLFDSDHSHQIHHLLYALNPSTFLDNVVPRLSVFDLTIHEYVDEYLMPNLCDDCIDNELIHSCLTYNANQHLFYVISSYFYSFELATNTWRIEGVIPFNQTNVGCALDANYSHIYIFGGTFMSQDAGEFSQNIENYTLKNNEWNTVTSAALNKDTNPIKCLLSPLDGNIYCVAAHTLYIFDTLHQTLVHSHLERTMHSHSLVSWH
eukprot:212340_1